MCQYQCSGTDPYNSKSECETDNPGKTCVEYEAYDLFGQDYKCAYVTSCDSSNGFYDTSEQCLADPTNDGYKCNGSYGLCVTKGDPSDCPENSVISTNLAGCGQTGGWELGNTNGYKSGTNECYICKPKDCLGGSNTSYQNIANCPIYEALNAVSSTQYGASGENTCYICNYQCKTDTYANQEDCQSAFTNNPCNTHTTQKPEFDTASSITCYSPDTCSTTDFPYTTCPTGTTQSNICQDTSGNHLQCTCNETTHFTQEQDCLNANDGYSCKPENNCYTVDVALTCPTGYDTYESVDECGNGTTGSKGWQLSEPNGKSGEKDCRKCEPLGCNTGYTSGLNVGTGEGQCNTSNGYTYSKDETRYNGDEVCGKCEITLCDTANGYSTDYQSVNDCGEAGSEPADKSLGWSFETSGKSGGNVCGKCTPLTCTGEYSGCAVLHHQHPAGGIPRALPYHRLLHLDGQHLVAADTLLNPLPARGGSYHRLHRQAPAPPRTARPGAYGRYGERYGGVTHWREGYEELQRFRLHLQ